jgi:serine/threonine protein kinase
VWLQPPPFFPLALHTQGGLALAHVFSIMRQALAGLRHLHSHGILHRDLRAANVLVASSVPLRVVLADFGLSHVLSVVARAAVAGATVTASALSVAKQGTAVWTRGWGVGEGHAWCGRVDTHTH